MSRKPPRVNYQTDARLVMLAYYHKLVHYGSTVSFVMIV